MTRVYKQKAFLHTISPYLYKEKIQKMDEISHHTKKISCLDHSMYVSYLSFLMARKLHVNIPTTVKGAMLHDLYLDDWSESKLNAYQRLVTHPKMALENAESFELSDLERDIIRKHMWPVTITTVPRKKEEIIVSLADKICTISEVSGVYWRLRCCRNLRKMKSGNHPHIA